MSREVISRDQFLSLKQQRRIDVPVPELGNGHVIPVWGMSARERTDFERSLTMKSGKPSEERQQEIRERLLVRCCRDDEGQPLFTMDDVKGIGEVNADVVERVVNVAMKLAGMTGADIEELAGN